MKVVHIWTINKWEKLHKDILGEFRKGLHIRFDKNVDVEVKRACKEFCKWLRSEYYFPKRVRLYIKASNFIKAMDGELVSATIWLPGDYLEEPYIRVSTGGYAKDVEISGQDDALASIICSISHELTHYFQWINGIELTEIGRERQASSYANFVLWEYAETREHP